MEVRRRHLAGEPLLSIKHTSQLFPLAETTGMAVRIAALGTLPTGKAMLVHKASDVRTGQLRFAVAMTEHQPEAALSRAGINREQGASLGTTCAIPTGATSPCGASPSRSFRN